jgi:hypothetical protein
VEDHRVRRVAVVVTCSVAAAVVIGGSLWAGHPEAAVVGIVTVLGTVVSVRNPDLGRQWYLVAGLVALASLVSAFLVTGNNGKLSGLLVMVAGIAAAGQILFIRSNHVPAFDYSASSEETDDVMG